MELTKKEILTTKAKHLKKKEPKLEFYRTASKAEFAEVFFEVLSEKTVSDNKWLKKQEIETPSSYTMRAFTAKDLAWCKKIIDNYKGYFFNSDITINFTGPPDIVEKMLTNIDNNGSSYKQFLSEYITELLTVAYANVVTDAPIKEEGGEQKLPYTYILPEENILDFAKDNISGEFLFFRYKNKDIIISGISRKQVDVYYAWMPDQIIIGTDTGDDFKDVTIDNELGYIPIHRVEISEGIPIIAPVAPIELDQMNLLTELRAIIRNQAFNILSMCNSAWKKLKGGITDKSVLVHPDDYSGPEARFVEYPSSGLDAHFNYNQMSTDLIYEISNLKRKTTNQAETTESMQMSFLDAKSVLVILADAVEIISNKIAEDWTEYTGKKIESQVNVNKDSFDIEGLTELLDNLIKALAIGLPEKAEQELLANSVEHIFKGSTDETKKEIMDLIRKQSRITNLDLGDKIDV